MDAEVSGGEVTSCTVVERVAHIVIERPEKRNAMSWTVLRRLAGHAREVAEDPQVRAVVVAGRGQHFSAGLDLVDLAALTGGDLDEARIAEAQGVFTAFEELDVPVLAAIDGVCLGAGLQFALACHLRAVTPEASLSVLEPRWGLVPDLGATSRLPWLIGPGRALELMLTVRRVDAAEALRVGLAEIALAPGDCLSAAHEIAARFAAGPDVLGALPRLVREARTASREAALRAEARAQLRALASGDLEASLRAAAEGRPSAFGDAAGTSVRPGARVEP